MRCQYCDQERETIPVRVTDLTTLNGHVMTSGRGGRERTYNLMLCGECVINLSGVPGGDNVRVEPDILVEVN